MYEILSSFVHVSRLSNTQPMKGLGSFTDCNQHKDTKTVKRGAEIRTHSFLLASFS